MRLLQVGNLLVEDVDLLLMDLLQLLSLVVVVIAGHLGLVAQLGDLPQAFLQHVRQFILLILKCMQLIKH